MVAMKRRDTNYDELLENVSFIVLSALRLMQLKIV